MTRNEIVENLEGVICPVVTPFNKRGGIDEGAFRDNLSRLAGIGLAGILVTGSTGEAPFLTQKERLRLVELARHIVKAPEILLVGTGQESTAATLDLSRESVSRGADALMILTPSYFKPQMDSEALVAHYRTVAAGVKRPVLFYYIPQYTGLEVDLATILNISRLPNIVGLKESSGSLELVRTILKKVRPDFSRPRRRGFHLPRCAQFRRRGRSIGPGAFCAVALRGSLRSLSGRTRRRSDRSAKTPAPAGDKGCRPLWRSRHQGRARCLRWPRRTSTATSPACLRESSKADYSGSPQGECGLGSLMCPSAILTDA